MRDYVEPEISDASNLTSIHCFFDKQTHILAKGKTPQSIQEVYKATGPHKLTKKTTKNQPTLSWRLSTPGNL